MAKINAHLHAFNVGEISRAGMARVDQARTRLAAEIQENLLPFVVGKAQVRPGTEFIATTPSHATSELIPFSKSANDTALLVASDAELRVLINDVYLARPSVTSSVTNGDFSSATGWTLTTTGGATANINSTAANALYMNCAARGGTATCTRSVSTSSAGIEHALRIVVERGPVTFRCGSSSGGDDYITETVLETGTHSLSFTPSGTYHVYFLTKRNVAVIVRSIQVESAGTVVLPAPWTSSQLKAIRYAQSLDEVFLTHTSWRQRRIQRSNNARSWSIVEYRTEDGPFMLSRSADVTLTPGATFGNTTLSSDISFFRPQHVGCLFRIYHPKVTRSINLGAVREYTDAIRVNGIGADKDFAVTISGTWSGTFTLQRSYVSGEESFVNTLKTYTTNVSSDVFQPGDSFNNVVHWYRIELTSYTSGTASITLFYTGDSGFGVCRVTGYNSETSVNIEILKPLANASPTKEWREGAWSDRAGWPAALAFIDGRLGFGRDDKWWMSESDNYYAFSLETEGDKRTIQRAIATGGGASTIRWMVPTQHLLVGTSDQIASVRSSALNEHLSAEATTVKDAATIRCAAVNPVRVDTRAIAIDESGRRVYELTQVVASGDYEAQEITALNEEIAGSDNGSINGLSIQRQPQTYIWHERTDGQCPVLLYEPKQEAAAYVRVVSSAAGGVIEDTCTLPGVGQDRIYVIVKRTINGNTVRYIEKLATNDSARGGTWNLMADSFVTASGPVSSVTAAHLANQTGLIGWGYLDGVGTPLKNLAADGSGNIPIGNTYTNVCVGLPYSWRYRSAKLAYGAQAGTALLQTKRVNHLGMLLIDTHKDAVRYGQDFDRMFPMPPVERGKPVTDPIHSVYDAQSFPFDGSWDTDSRVCLAGEAPYPATLVGLVVGIETNEQV